MSSISDVVEDIREDLGRISQGIERMQRVWQITVVLVLFEDILFKIWG